MFSAGLDARRFDFVSPVTKEQTAVAFTVQDGKAFTFNFHNSAPLSDKRSLVLFERLLYSFSLNPEPSDPLPNFYENLKDKVGIFFPKHYIVQEGFMGTTVTLIEQGGVSNDFATNVKRKSLFSHKVYHFRLLSPSEAWRNLSHSNASKK